MHGSKCYIKCDKEKLAKGNSSTDNQNNCVPFDCNCESCLCFRVYANSETESEAGDFLDQEFEEHNSNLTSAADPTGYLRKVSINNHFKRFEFSFYTLNKINVGM